MKAEELMLGDWVYFEDKPIKIKNIYEEEINLKFNNFSGLVDDSIHESYISPIPLTTEILEKNSFLEVEAIEYPSHRVGISFVYRNTFEGLRIFVQNACTGGPTCTMIKTCKYVHEVQHMIKMCDIERTFVL